jgi:subtilisin family serine protease
VASEWWRAAVGADVVEPPGPGKPVTVVDTGLDMTHPEFAGRPNTIPLNEQQVEAGGIEFHGTAVSSLVAAPANGVGVVGVYPDAVLQVWDADLSGALTTSEVIAGIEAATKTGPGVINLSLGSTEFDPMLRDAIMAAFAKGLVVVAAAGNERSAGSPPEFPANLSHVLTVAATDEQGNATSFSNASQGVDLAAPGQDIPIAVPLWADPSGYSVGDGTSFAAPIVAGATAWVWTARPDLDNTQVFDLMRFSAKDIGEPGFDSDTGFGLLDIPSALAYPAPPPDPLEPNDDIYLVRADGLFATGARAVADRLHQHTKLVARLDATEDPEDVYRVLVPSDWRLVATLKASDEVNLAIWGPRTRSVHERGAAFARDLVALSDIPGKTQVVRATNSARSTEVLYLDAFPGQDVPNGRYTLTIGLEPR